MMRAPLVVTPSSLRLTNATTTAYPFKLQLGQAPGSTVVVSLASQDTTRGMVAPASLTFTTQTWSTPQAFTLSTTPLASPNSSPLTVAFRTKSTDMLYNNLPVGAGGGMRFLPTTCIRHIQQQACGCWWGALIAYHVHQ